jgi:SAM-dependent methyltransferase
MKRDQQHCVDSRQLAIEHWDRTPLYVSEHDRYSIMPWLYLAAEFEQHRGERVLEIGCGTGCDLLQFRKHGATAVGVDVTPEHLRLAQKRNDNAVFLCRADARRLPFRDESFDYVYSHGVLHHIEQPRQTVKEIFRVLRPGGRFNIHVYALWSLFLLATVIQHGYRWRLWIENSRDPVHIDLYTVRKLRQLFEPAEITVQKYLCRQLPFAERWLGFFLVAKGNKLAFGCD